MGSSLAHLEKDNLINLRVRRSSKKFGKEVLIRLEIRKSSQVIMKS
jgi:hypothetical protein